MSFVDEAEIEDLHVRYMDEPGPTDVLSFAQDDGDGVLGDVVICPAVAARNNPDDPAAELRLLLVHGILHLLGSRPRGRRGEGRDVGEAGALQRGGGAVTWGWILAGVLVVLGSVLAMAESSLTRMTRVRALALESEGRRNAHDPGPDRVRPAALPELDLPVGDARAERLGGPRGRPRREDLVLERRDDRLARVAC